MLEEVCNKQHLFEKSCNNTHLFQNICNKLHMLFQKSSNTDSKLFVKSSNRHAQQPLNEHEVCKKMHILTYDLPSQEASKCTITLLNMLILHQ